tara:strand:- start:3944 stop:4201 length:258 start_codon:yes stop_codon:yes gene_type:complete
LNPFSIYTIVIITQLKKWLDLTIKIKIKIMANSQEIFEQIKELYTQFENEHNGTTKAAKGRARKAIGEIKKLVTDYRKVSIEETK